MEVHAVTSARERGRLEPPAERETDGTELRRASNRGGCGEEGSAGDDWRRVTRRAVLFDARQVGHGRESGGAERDHEGAEREPGRLGPPAVRETDGAELRRASNRGRRGEEAQRATTGDS